MFYAAVYDPSVILLSILVAVLASYTALSLVQRIHYASGFAAHWWRLGGAVSMGVGIWAMHFVGMLAFDLPIPLGYDLSITLLSLVIAIVTSGYALSVAARDSLPWQRLLGCATLMGLGIAAMHYAGMEALRMQPRISYDIPLFLLSVAVAIVAAALALYLAYALRNIHSGLRIRRVGAAIFLGLGIAGMHYIGMAAANFPVGSVCLAATAGLDGRWLVVLVVVVSLGMLATTLLTAVIDAKLATRTVRLADSLAEANEALQRQAYYDRLTGLPNRTLLEERLDQAIARAELVQSRFAVMHVDLDGFKAFNDSLGHYWGDQLLVKVAERLRGALADTDTVARFSGDEFVVLTFQQDPDAVQALGDHLVRLFHAPFTFDGRPYHVSLSVGVAMYPEHGTTAHRLMVNAGSALNHVKRNGRNSCATYEPSMGENAFTALAMTQDLRGSLDAGQLRLHYQPKLACPSGPMVGVEALIRWEHPQKGMIYPDAFIGLAERSGLIVPMGEWVLREACRQMKEWHDQGHGHWSVSVNLSAPQFNSDGLVPAIERALAGTGLPPHALMIEITESLAMQDVDSTLATLRTIRSLGVQIAIDDFGTGYSSLLYLKRLPANEIKIDRGFVRELQPGNEDAVIVSAIIGLGKALGFSLVAEGVETRDQLDFLIGCGCDVVQGYYISRPVAPQALIEWVQQSQGSEFPGVAAGLAP